MDLLCTFAVIESNPWYCHSQIERKQHSKMYIYMAMIVFLDFWCVGGNSIFLKIVICVLLVKKEQVQYFLSYMMRLGHLSCGLNTFTWPKYKMQWQNLDVRTHNEKSIHRCDTVRNESFPFEIRFICRYFWLFVGYPILFKFQFLLHSGMSLLYGYMNFSHTGIVIEE